MTGPIPSPKAAPNTVAPNAGPGLDAASTPKAGAKREVTARFNDRTAREVLLLRAYESVSTDDKGNPGDNPIWTKADSQWASRVASESAGPNAPAAAFIEARAHAAMQRLEPRDQGVRNALAMRGWRWGWIPLVALVGLAIGAVVYDIGTHQRIDLLSLPVWMLVAWNVVVYLLLALFWFKGLGSANRQGGKLRQFIGKRLASKVSGVTRKKPALASYAATWSKVAWPMTVARAGAVLHVGAAALALGLIGGMYLRGLVLDYRAGWQSTFLEPPAVHSVLQRALAPASRLTGITVPDEVAITTLRVLPGTEAKGEAASWIHLYAATLTLWVVLPRLLLALGSLLRGAWLARRLPVTIDDPYHQRLLQHHRASASTVRVHPHGTAPDASAALGLQKLVTRIFGDRAELSIAPLAPYGAEDVVASISALESDTVKIALFDLSATPELEAQGRFVQALRDRSARGATVVMLVDEAAFNSRFGEGGERAQQRRAAWQELADKVGMPHPVFVNLAAPHVDHAARALEAAMSQLDARALA